MTIFGINNELKTLHVFFFFIFLHDKKCSVSVRGFVTFKTVRVHNCKPTFPLGNFYRYNVAKFLFNGFYSVILYWRKTRFLILETEITQSIFNFF